MFFLDSFFHFLFFLKRTAQNFGRQQSHWLHYILSSNGERKNINSRIEKQHSFEKTRFMFAILSFFFPFFLTKKKTAGNFVSIGLSRILADILRNNQSLETLSLSFDNFVLDFNYFSFKFREKTNKRLV